MPDENRFAGLGDQLGDGDSGEDDSTDADNVGDNGSDTDSASVRETASAASSAVEPTAQGESTSDPSDVDSDELSESGPAFSFDDTQAKSLYVRPETVELLEDTEFEVESILRRDHGIRDLTGREFHDALVRAVAADPEAVAEFVVDARDE